MKYTTTAAVVAFTVLLAGVTTAGTVTSSQSGNWSAQSTWGGNPAPVAGDAVIILGGFSVTVDVSNAACASLQLGGTVSNTGSGTLIFSSGSQVTISGSVTVGASNNHGSITMTSGGTLLCEGFTLNSLGTWAPGIGTVELTASNTLPNSGITSFNNLTVGSGTTTINANLNVAGNLLIDAGATLDCGLRTLTVGGNWTNEGTFTGGTGTVIFDRNGNQTVTGTGSNNFNLIRVNMGTSNANTLEILSSNFSAPDAFLTLSNGTFKISGTFTFTNTFLLGPVYNIQPTTGLWINNPNVTVTAQAGGVSARGILRVSAGSYNIGTSVDHNLDYVAGSSIIIEGGTLTIAGHMGRNSPASTTAYTQSDGTVTVVTRGSTDVTNAGFDLGAAGSSFTMSGGTIVVANATSNTTDFLNVAGTANVTGGTLQIGNAGTLNAQTLRIQSSVPAGNILISNATAQPIKPTAELVSSSLTVLGDVTIQSGSRLNANSLDVSLKGNWSDGGTFTPGPLVTFDGSGAQAITSASGESFSGLTISKAGGTLTLNNPVTVNGSFSLTQGALSVGSTTLALNGTVTGGGTLTSGDNGTVKYNQSAAGQSVLAGVYGNLLFSDFDKVLPGSGTVSIAGTFGPGVASGHTTSGSTVEFDGGAQDIPAFPYNNLILSGAGAKTGAGTMTVNGNLTVNSGVTLSGITGLTLNGTTHTNGGSLSASTVSVGAAGTLTNSGTLTVSVSLTGPGTLTQGATGNLILGGTGDITTMNASAAGNTVSYTGTGQTVRLITYHNLTLSGSGSVSLAGINTINGNFTLAGTFSTSATVGMTIGGNFTIGTGTAFDAGSFSHSVQGNWSNGGTFFAGTSTFIFSGTGPQTIGAASFFGITINNPAGVSMAGDVTVAGPLTLTNGSLAIGAHALTLNSALATGSGSLVGGSTSNIFIGGSAAGITLPGMVLNILSINRPSGIALAGDITINGLLTTISGSLSTGGNSIILGPNGSLSEAVGVPVVGNVRTTRGISATSGTETFGNIGAEITLNGTAMGSTTVARKTGIAATGNGHSSIRRYFDISPSVNSGLNAGFGFHYDTSEVTGQNTGALDIYRSRDNGVTWSDLGGTVNTGARTITLTGVNDFSRWTASDTSNRIGITVTPTISGISPSSKRAGDPGFTLTVNGSDYVNGKSTVLIKGHPRSTTFVSASQLTASIPATDLLVAGTFPVTVLNSGGGVSNSATLTVSAGIPSSVAVETASDGSGTIVPAQSLVSGTSITLYAIARDSLHNFSSNVAAGSWDLQSVTGSLVAGDLLPAVDGKSAVFTAHRTGSAAIRATSGSLVQISSGTITVVAGNPKKVRVETTADGSGVVVPAETLAVGASITVFAIKRDSLDNFLGNIAADSWSLQNVTGGVVQGDLLPAADGKSAVFTAHVGGTASIFAGSGTLAAVTSGTITVGVVQAVDKEFKPLVFALEQNYPNPFNPSTTIRYQVPAASDVRLAVYDIIGREVSILVDERKEAGIYEVRFDASQLASGTYIYRLVAGSLASGNGSRTTSSGFVQTRKLVLVK